MENMNLMTILLTIFAVADSLLSADCFSTNASATIVTEETSFCEAHGKCFKKGQEIGHLGYMVGEHFQKLLDREWDGLGVWVNKHCLLHPVCRAQDTKWIYGEKASTYNGSVMTKMKTNNAVGSHRVMVYKSGRKILRVSGTNGKHAYGCNFSSFDHSKSDVRLELFASDISDYKMLHADSDQTAGCFSWPTGSTLIYCALK